MRVYSLSLMLVAAACVIASGVQPAEPQESGAADLITSAVPIAEVQTLTSAPDLGIYKLGAVELPYMGDGLIEYDREHRLWNIAFAAPEGWQCTHVGWSFSVGDGTSDDLRAVSAMLREGGEEESGENGVVTQLGVEYWSVSGILEADVADGVLHLSISTSDKTYALDFSYDPEMADPDLTFVQSASTGVLTDVTDDSNNALKSELGVPYVVDDSHDPALVCPGGWCKCVGKCLACCPKGFYPSCKKCGLNTASCDCLKVVSIELELRDIRVSE